MEEYEKSKLCQKPSFAVLSMMIRGTVPDTFVRSPLFAPWIAATAIFLDIPLITNNRRDFIMIDRLQLITHAPE